MREFIGTAVEADAASSVQLLIDYGADVNASYLPQEVRLKISNCCPAGAHPSTCWYDSLAI